MNSASANRLNQTNRKSRHRRHRRRCSLFAVRRWWICAKKEEETESGRKKRKEIGHSVGVVLYLFLNLIQTIFTRFPSFSLTCVHSFFPSPRRTVRLHFAQWISVLFLSLLVFLVDPKPSVVCIAYDDRRPSEMKKNQMKISICARVTEKSRSNTCNAISFVCVECLRRKRMKIIDRYSVCRDGYRIETLLSFDSLWKDFFFFSEFSLNWMWFPLWVKSKRNLKKKYAEETTKSKTGNYRIFV